MTTDNRDDEWEKLWDARKRFLEHPFGATDENVGHAPVPFEFGQEAGGAADVLYFRGWSHGVLSVTAALLGNQTQPASDIGQYELAICHRGDDEWGPNIISQLAHYTLDCVLSPGETMSIASAAPDGASVSAFLFETLHQSEFEGNPAGVLLCIGITEDELEACQAGRLEEVRQALKAQNVYPYTDLNRPSVLQRKKRWGLF